jgi:PAS domain S-box-containing protein
MSLPPALRRMTDAQLDDLVPGFNEISKGGLLVGACVYAALALLHLAVQPPGMREILFTVAAATALFLSAYHGALGSQILPRTAVRWAMLSITLAVWLNSALRLWLTGEAIETTNLAIVVVIAGIVLIRRKEFVAVLALTVAAFAIASVNSGPGQNWFHYGVHLGEAIVVAATTFVWKRMALLRSHELRTQEMRVRQEGEQNLRRAQEADATLRENEERFRMLFALAPVGIALNRMSDGRFLIGSKALFEMVGYSETEFANLTYWDITPRDYDEDEARQLESLRTQGRYGPYEKEYIRKGGERFPVLLQGRRLTDNTGQELILSVIQDISMQKASQAALAAARDAAETANIAKSRFLATMSHELRTPLNAILGFSEIIAKETFGPAGCPQYIEYASIIHESGAYLLSLIGDVLDLSKIEAGKMELRPEANDLSELLTESVRLVGAMKHTSNAGPTPQIKVARGLPLLMADRRAAIQMIVNLVSNAVKFTPAGGQITIEAGRCDDGGIFVRVADTGIGIAKADIPKALAPFSQIDDGRSRHRGGTGLGLPIVKSLIELHGGAFTLDSELGKGTCATLTFPAIAARAVNAA